ncbi:uncharacterized protein ATNIH1004_011549 [Aspergillus tanneri]|uniref:Secreted protein n=1 Tax=Aspergillus tanneri TaxID=1220188 RepID=A0A5M9MBD2_9EURO|nr:uncharacterized protein ATNIH1004_011549 [Aspergillus tanneri]KAA8642604.1 hypothetical protein ATNIH1004_011549 [Aspergillus tanneri]
MYFLASVMLTLVAINGVHAAVTSTAFSTATPSPNPSERSANPPETARTMVNTHSSRISVAERYGCIPTAPRKTVKSSSLPG